MLSVHREDLEDLVTVCVAMRPRQLARHLTALHSDRTRTLLSAIYATLHGVDRESANKLAPGPVILPAPHR
jgi:hypothetical protein